MARIFWSVAIFLVSMVMVAHLFVYLEAVTNPVDTLALQAIYRALHDPDGHLSNWRGSNPCEDNWEGIVCSEPQGTNNITYVTELRLFGRNLGGTLAPELGNLTQLEYLNIMWNKLTGSIPSTLGKVDDLEILLLNGNQLNGTLPPELGSLTKLTRIQIDENQISGPIPPEFSGMTSMEHLHMNNNSLNGSLPKELGTLPNLIHILLDNNKLTGYLPPEIAYAPSLLIIQLDNNQFASNATIPATWGTIPKLLKLSLRHCGLTGTIPDLANLTHLEVLDLSNNKLTGIIPNRAALPVNLTSIDLSHNQLSGQIPQSIGNLQLLEYLTLKNNKLSGAVPQNLGTGKAFQTAQGLQVIDLQINQLTSFNASLATLESKTSTKVRLAGNPTICGNANLLTNPLCVPSNDPFLVPYDSSVALEPSSSNSCHACQPITIGYRLKSPGFSSFDRYDSQFLSWFSAGLNLTQSQVVLKDYTWERGPRLRMTILLFSRNGTSFQQPEFDRLYTNFSQWDLPDSARFGPWELLSFDPRSFAGFTSTIHGLSKGAMAGIVVGVAVFAMAVTGLVLFVFYWRRRPSAAVRAQIKRLTKAKSNPALKVSGVIAFTFEELSRATSNFDDKNLLGQGGYGKVYVGDLKDGKQRVAIKRAEPGSLQGAHEFYTEIELLSRVHHRNLCGLVGYCDDVGEQMLVYEFMPGGTLRDHLSALAGTPLNFPTRLRIALGSARGILYLHKEANPPIFHRDIKASNILLDARMVAKVADFGLSRLAPVPDFEGATPGHISTLVKGTPGYMDPEYFLTHKLTDKSDVYSFGVVLLELITGMHAISKGKNIVREAHARNEAGEMLSMIDPHIAHYSPKALKAFMQLAVSCCSSSPDERPTMTEVVHTLEELSRQYADLFSDGSSIEPSSTRTASDSSTVPSLPHSHPYSSREISGADTSELFSGTVMHVAPSNNSPQYPEKRNEIRKQPQQPQHAQSPKYHADPEVAT
ncbi:hypothetical protein M758_3G085700 [Ceratodon purpureus]|nr:hypothetical protein M758_3G085700 [Ceratodon purpureus]